MPPRGSHGILSIGDNPDALTRATLCLTISKPAFSSGIRQHHPQMMASGPFMEPILQHAGALQSELKLFAAHVGEASVGSRPQILARISALVSDIQHDVQTLERRAGAGLVSESNALAGVNLPFYQAVWDMAKRCRDVVDLRCKICMEPPGARPALAPGIRMGMPSLGTQCSSRLRHVVVDIVADGGRSWYKVSAATNKRLLFDLAKEAVYCGEDGEEADLLTEDDLDIPVLKTAKELAQTATLYRIRNRRPTAHLVLPRVVEGEHAEVDRLLALCRRTGTQVLCEHALSPVPVFSPELLRTLFPGPFASFSAVLNVDTSLLIALASDFSHTVAAREPWWNRQHVAHGVQECREPFLPVHAYPALGTHALVCVPEAADTLRHIVATMATDDEKARARILLGDYGSNDDDPAIEEALRRRLQALSRHPVPPGLRLPIHVVEPAESEAAQAQLPEGIQGILAQQLNPGRSVFGYGWAVDWTTVTCNHVAVKQMAAALEQLEAMDADAEDEAEAPWPSMYALPGARPLVGTPAPGRAKKHIGDCAGPHGCSCGIQKFYPDQDR